MKLLVETSDAGLGEVLAMACERNGHDTRRATSLRALEELLDEAEFDLAVVDLSRRSHVGELESLLKRMPSLRVLALTSDSSANAVVEGLRAGAHEVLVKPFGVEQLEPALRRAAGSLRTAFDWVAAAESSRSLMQRAQRAAVTSASLLIRGEFGVGKTQLARLIHDLSPRRAGPRVEVHLNELDEADAIVALLGSVAPDGTRRPGSIESAEGGTLILDGIEGLRREPAAGTAADGASALEHLLLDFLERREVKPIGAGSSIPVDVRIVATLRTRAPGPTRAAPTALETRLGVVSLDLLPLALRREDIAPLTAHFVSRFAGAQLTERPQLDASTLSALEARDFSGNVTELRNLIERAVLLFPGARVDLAGITGDPIPPAAASSEALESLNLREMERVAVIRSLELARGNRSLAARALGVSTRTLRNKIQAYGLR